MPKMMNFLWAEIAIRICISGFHFQFKNNKTFTFFMLSTIFFIEFFFLIYIMVEIVSGPDRWKVIHYQDEFTSRLSSQDRSFCSRSLGRLSCSMVMRCMVKQQLEHCKLKSKQLGNYRQAIVVLVQLRQQRRTRKWLPTRKKWKLNWN